MHHHVIPCFTLPLNFLPVFAAEIAVARMRQALIHASAFDCPAAAVQLSARIAARVSSVDYNVRLTCATTPLELDERGFLRRARYMYFFPTRGGVCLEFKSRTCDALHCLCFCLSITPCTPPSVDRATLRLILSKTHELARLHLVFDVRRIRQSIRDTARTVCAVASVGWIYAATQAGCDYAFLKANLCLVDKVRDYVAEIITGVRRQCRRLPGGPRRLVRFDTL
jgi:hypothetical protein